MTNQTIEAMHRAAARACCITAMALLAGPAYGQSGNTTTVHVPTYKCSTTVGTGMFAVAAWSVGSQSTVTNPRFTGGAASTSAANLAPLQVVKGFDACSAALFQDAVTGGHITGLHLTVSKDRINVMAIGLSEVTVSSYQLGATGANVEPAETITFTYGKITITNYGPGGGSFCWDLVTRRECQGTVITPVLGLR